MLLVIGHLQQCCVCCLHTHSTQTTVRTSVYTFSCVNHYYLCLFQTYIHTILQLYEDMLHISTWIYINTEGFVKPILTHACVWIACRSACGLYTTSTCTTCSSLTLDGLFIYHAPQYKLNPLLILLLYIRTIFVILWFNAFAEPSTRTYLILALIFLLKGNLRCTR